jgi:hypothetical protein
VCFFKNNLDVVASAVQEVAYSSAVMELVKQKLADICCRDARDEFKLIKKDCANGLSLMHGLNIIHVNPTTSLRASYVESVINRTIEDWLVEGRLERLVAVKIFTIQTLQEKLAEPLCDGATVTEVLAQSTRLDFKNNNAQEVRVAERTPSVFTS